MFITIRNLTLDVRTKNIKALINDKCLISDVIIGEIVRDDETSNKKVTIGLADECDAAIVFRKLNGVVFNGLPLIVEDSRKKKGPVPGELTPMQYKATTMHMQTQQIMIPGYSAMGMVSTGFYDPMQAMMQSGVVYPHASGFAQPMIITNQEATLLHGQPIPGQEMSQYDYQQPYAQQANAQARPRPQINQPRQQMNQPRQQMNQPRPQMNQPRQQMKQPRQQMNKPRQQMNQPRQQMNQPRQQMNQPRQQINQPRPLLNQPRRQMNQPRPQMNQPPHQQGSKRPSYEEPRNAYENPHNPEPYTKTVVHQKVLDWDIPSREVVVKETDPVWGVRIKKPSEMTPKEMSEVKTLRSKWHDPGLATQNYADNREPYVTGGYSHDDGEAYDYNEPSTHNQPYVEGYSNESYENLYQHDVNQDTMAPDVAYDPAWEPHQANDNYDTFAANNRKRTYSETQPNEYQTGNVNPAYQGQGNMHKRNKPDYYENSYNPNEMVAEYDESAVQCDESAAYDEKDLEPDIIDGIPFLSFKKFKFTHKLPIAQFKAFEKYMLENLPSRRFKTNANAKAYNRMYAICRKLMKKIENFLGINLRKYSYFLLNYIQLSIERAMGERLYRNTWKVATFQEAFNSNYTYQSFFLEFKNWFEHYEKLEFQETPKFKAAMSEPRRANMIDSSENLIIGQPIVKKNPVKTIPGRIVFLGKPGGKLKGAQAAYDREYQARQLVDVSANAGPGTTTSKSVTPAVIQKNAVVYGKPEEATVASGKPEATVSVPDKPGATVSAEKKPGVPTNAQDKPGVPTNAQNKAGAPTNAQSKPGTTVTAQNKPGAPTNAQNKSGAPTNAQNKPGAPTNAQNKPGAPINAQNKGKTTIAPGKSGSQGSLNKVQNLAGAIPVIEDPEPKTDTSASMDMVRSKARTILGIEMNMMPKMFESFVMEPELNEAFEEELKAFNAINDTVWPNTYRANNNQVVLKSVPPKDREPYNKVAFKRNMKRLMYNRIFNKRISRTAKITFSTTDKEPSLEACTDYFTARHANVLLTQNNIAIVLFDTNEHFNEMYDEKNAAVIDGCRIQDMIPLDLDMTQLEYQMRALEVALENGDKDIITNLVFNKEFIKTKTYRKKSNKMKFIRRFQEYDCEDNEPQVYDKSNADKIEKNGNDEINEETTAINQDTNATSPKSLKEKSLDILNSQLVENQFETQKGINSEMQKQLVEGAKDNLKAEMQKELTPIKKEELTAINKDKSKVETQEGLNEGMEEKLNSQIQDELNSQIQDKLNSQIQDELNSQIQDKLNSEMQFDADTEKQAELDIEKQADLDIQKQADFDVEMQEEIKTKSDQDNNDQDPKPVLEVDDERDEKIKEFLEDFEKIVNENDEIFRSEDKIVNENEEIYMSEEDLEDFIL